MTMDEQEGSDVDGFPLPQTMRDGWKATEIVYTRYTFDPARPQKTLRGDPRSLVIARTDVEAFVRERVSGADVPHLGEVRHRDERDKWPVADRPIDIYVGGACYVVIELDSALNWQFRPGRPAVTALENNFDDNGGLHHVMPNGEILGGSGPTGDGCRIAYFGVNRRCTFEHQQFVCHVEPGPKGLGEPVMVDPDIPNDGGKFPFVGRANQTRGPITGNEPGQ